MSTGKSPAYQWYPKDAATDETFRLMTYEEQGMYRALLDHQWLEGSIPADPKTLAALLNVHWRTFKKSWTILERKFVPQENHRLVNERLHKQRVEYDAFCEKQAKNGRKSAEASQKVDSQASVLAKPNGSQTSTVGQLCSLQSAVSSLQSAKQYIPPLPPVGEERWKKFWDAYPKRRAKAAAEKAWKKLNPDDVLTARIVGSVEQHAISPEWQRDGGQFVPYPATFLNQRRWEDEIDERPRVSGKTAGNLEAARQFVARGDNAS